MELCICCWEELQLMGVTTLLFSRVKIKKVKSLMSLEEILCGGIKYWDILERRVFNHYKVKVWLKVCLIVIQILICEHCLHGKQNRVKFPFGAPREKRSWT